MVEFIVRARAAPTDPDAFRAAIGRGVGVEYLSDILRSSLMVSQGHRSDVNVNLVLEKSRDYSRVLGFDGANLGSIDNLHESAFLDAITSALTAGKQLAREGMVRDSRGVQVQALSFEHLVKARAAAGEVYLLDPEGEDIRTLQWGQNPVFVMTDHTPMPKNTYRSMARQGVKKVSVGPVMLHAAQCISIILNEHDRRI